MTREFEPASPSLPPSVECESDKQGMLSNSSQALHSTSSQEVYDEASHLLHKYCAEASRLPLQEDECQKKDYPTSTRRTEDGEVNQLHEPLPRQSQQELLAQVLERAPI